DPALALLRSRPEAAAREDLGGREERRAPPRGSTERPGFRLRIRRLPDLLARGDGRELELARRGNRVRPPSDPARAGHRAQRQVELADLHERMLAPLRAQWSREQRIYDRYTTGGQALSDFEALPLYTTAHSLAELADPRFAEQLYANKIVTLRAKALEGRDTPYYLHNSLCFDEALWLGETRRLDEPLPLLPPLPPPPFPPNLPP